MTFGLWTGEKEDAIYPSNPVMELEDFPVQKALRPGEVIWGKVVSLDRDGAWVDIGSKSEGLIPPQEMKSRSKTPLEVEEEVLVQVLEPYVAGRALLSLDRARRFMGWYRLEKHLESGEPVEAVAVSSNKGGLLVRYEGIQGFVPLSQLAGMDKRKDDSWIKAKLGQHLRLKVIELDQAQGKFILSERAVAEVERAKLLAEIKEGEVKKGRVTGIHNFGLFVDLGGVEGLVPASELSWDRGKNPQDMAQVGQEVEVVVMKVEVENKKLLLSLKRATPHPWETVMERFEVGRRVEGVVSRLFPFGALVSLEGGIEGLVHVSEMSSRRINHPKEVLKVGQVLPFTILSINPEKRQLRLSLKQAQEEDYHE